MRAISSATTKVTSTNAIGPHKDHFPNCVPNVQKRWLKWIPAVARLGTIVGANSAQLHQLDPNPQQMCKGLKDMAIGNMELTDTVCVLVFHVLPFAHLSSKPNIIRKNKSISVSSISDTENIAVQMVHVFCPCFISDSDILAL